MSEERFIKTGILADMELVHRQLHCVLHLCETVSVLANTQIKMLPKTATDKEFGHHLIKMSGDWSNRFMQNVGDLLNGIGAESDDDSKWDATFQEASERWKDFIKELNDSTK